MLRSHGDLLHSGLGCLLPDDIPPSASEGVNTELLTECDSDSPLVTLHVLQPVRGPGVRHLGAVVISNSEDKTPSGSNVYIWLILNY